MLAPSMADPFGRPAATSAAALFGGGGGGGGGGSSGGGGGSATGSWRDDSPFAPQVPQDRHGDIPPAAAVQAGPFGASAYAGADPFGQPPLGFSGGPF
eukprot:scaffold76508_cov24-Phaeocystis_antarctica.AAC.1